MKPDPQTPVRIVEPSDPPEGSVRQDPITDSIPALAIVNAILRNRIRILSIVTVLCLAVLIYGLMKPREFISDASFSVQGSGSQRLSGIAAQFGLAMPANDGAQSPAYYVELLGSREILLGAAASRYSYRRDGKPASGALPDIYDISGTDSAQRYDKAVLRLRKAIVVDKSRETGIVRVSVAAPSAQLAQQILTRVLGFLNEFNLKTRQSQAANERRFIEQRMTEIGTDLRVAEDRLKEFLQRNRGSFASIPDLSLEHDRLVRDVALQQEVYTALAQSHEQARIDEVRDTPALTVIESPSLPVRAASRGLLRMILLAFIVSLLFAVFPSAISVLFSSKPRSAEEEAAEFRRLRRDIVRWKRDHSKTRFGAREA